MSTAAISNGGLMLILVLVLDPLPAKLSLWTRRTSTMPNFRLC
jgi:hypothetical protein